MQIHCIARNAVEITAALCLAVMPVAVWSQTETVFESVPAEVESNASDSAEADVLEVPAPAVVIEGELPHLEPTPQEMIEHFRAALRGTPSFLAAERRLADGTIETTTSIGRLCSPALPVQWGAGIGGDVRLLGRCAAF